jgi:tetratricopeptide (TPR) repeat protein
MKLLLVFTLFFCSSVYCSTDPVAELSSGNIDKVEQHFSQIQNEFYENKIDEYSFFEQYKSFYLNDEKYIAIFNSWIDKYPKSDSAYLARGIFYRKLGEFKRGYKFTNEVTKENMDYMLEMYKLSEKDLLHALFLNEKSYISILNLINIDQYRSDAESARKHLAMANKIYPQNMLVRCRYLIHLTPKWGGDYSLMDKFIETSQSEGLSNDKINLLYAIKYDDMGDMAQLQNKIDLAIKYYEKALNLSQSGPNYFRNNYLDFSLQLCSMPKYKSEKYCTAGK